MYPESRESLRGTDIVLGSTEPANYRGSYTTALKERIGIEIAMYRNARILTTDAMAIVAPPRTEAIGIIMKLLDKLTVCEQGGLRN